jgi:ferredoxin
VALNPSFSNMMTNTWWIPGSLPVEVVECVPVVVVVVPEVPDEQAAATTTVTANMPRVRRRGLRAAEASDRLDALPAFGAVIMCSVLVQTVVACSHDAMPTSHGAGTLLEGRRDSGRILMKVVVDFDECASNAVCMGIAPEVFEVRDDGLLYVLNEHPGEELREQVRQAANGCPTGAISIVEDD